MGLGALLGACHPARDRALEDLRATEPGVRAAAAVRLAGVGDAECLPALRRAVRDRDGEVRRAAIASLVALRDRKGADAILEALDDHEVQVRLAAVRALGDLRVRRAADALLDRMADPNLVVRRAAQKALADLGVPRGRQVGRLAARQRKALRARMTEGGDGAIAAARLLLADEDPDAARRLVEVLEQHLLEPGDELVLARSLGAAVLPRDLALRTRTWSPALQTALVEGAAESDRPDREALLVEALSAASTEVRRAAIAGLAEGRASPAARAAACRALSDPDPEIAALAADVALEADASCEGPLAEPTPLAVLARLAKRQAALVPELAERLPREAGDPATWRAASRVADVAVATALAAVLAREVQTRADQAARWIPETVWRALAPGDEEEPAEPSPRPGAGSGQHSADAIAQLLRRFPARGETDELWPTTSDPERVRAAGIAAAQAARDEAARAAVAAQAAALATSADPALRRAAAAILAEQTELAVPEALPVDPDPGVRAEIARALGKRGARAWLERLVKDDDEMVRRAACAAVAEARVAVAPAVLREALRRDGSPEALAAVARALGAGARDDLGDLLRGDEATVGPALRLAALDALGRIADRRDIAIVGTALDSADPSVRAAAAAALARLGGTEARARLEEHAEDFDAGVRRAVAAALRALR